MCTVHYEIFVVITDMFQKLKISLSFIILILIAPPLFSSDIYDDYEKKKHRMFIFSDSLNLFSDFGRKIHTININGKENFLI